MKKKYVVRELLAVTKIDSLYGDMWIVWRGSRILGYDNGWLDYPDISEVMTFKSHRMARRSAFEWHGFTMDIDDAIDNRWMSE